MITWDELDVLVRSAQPILAATLYPAAALLGIVHGAELHRLGDENVHTVDDYKPAAAPAPVRQRRRLRRPAATPIHNRLAAEQVVAEVMRERYGTTNRSAIAAQMLREVA